MSHKRNAKSNYSAEAMNNCAKHCFVIIEQTNQMQKCEYRLDRSYVSAKSVSLVDSTQNRTNYNSCSGEYI